MTVVLYDGDGTVLDRIRVGDMSASGESPTRRDVRISREYRQAYVVIESPGFWGERRSIPVVAFEWEQNSRFYERYSVDDQNEKLAGD